jgi:hypothetical protein
MWRELGAPWDFFSVVPIGDVDGDGFADSLVRYTGRLGFRRGGPSGYSSTDVHSTALNSDQNDHPLIADINGDGRLDAFFKRELHLGRPGTPPGPFNGRGPDYVARAHPGTSATSTAMAMTTSSPRFTPSLTIQMFFKSLLFRGGTRESLAAGRCECRRASRWRWWPRCGASAVVGKGHRREAGDRGVRDVL